MNSSILNSKKKRRSSGKFLISNKQAKLIINRKCRRVNLLDKNRHINENETSISEEAPISDTVKQEPVLAESVLPMEHDQTLVTNQEQQQPQVKTSETTETTTKSISKLSELKNKFTNFKNTLVKSISNIKKPPSANNNNLVVVKEEKSIPTIKSSASFHRTTSTSSTLARQTSRKELPNNENTKPVANEPTKRLSALTRSSSVSTIKTTTQFKGLKKYESTTSFKSVNSLHLQQQNQKENQRPAFNQYAKITYNDRMLYQPVSPMQKKVELRRILAHKNMSSSHNKLDALK